MRKLFDSKDLQEYVESIGYEFSPAEEIVLTAFLNIPLQEKLKIYQEYVDGYKDEEFRADDTTVIEWMNTDEECGFREILIRIINRYKKLLSEIKESEGYVFSANLSEEGFKEVPYILFSSYEAAFKYLINEKNSYLEYENLKSVVTHSEIRKIPLNSFDEDDGDYDSIIFNDKLEIVDIYPSFKYRKEFSILLTESIYIHIPLPFKAGDIVKSVPSNGNGETIYGVMKTDCIVCREDDIYFQKNLCADVMDMVVDLDRYDMPCLKAYIWQWLISLKNGQVLVGTGDRLLTSS